MRQIFVALYTLYVCVREGGREGGSVRVCTDSVRVESGSVKRVSDSLVNQTIFFRVYVSFLIGGRRKRWKKTVWPITPGFR